MIREMILATCALGVMVMSQAQGLEYDAAFGDNGISYQDPFLYEDGRSMVFHSDGRMTFGTRYTDSQGSNSIGLTQINADGTLNGGFGDNGSISLDYGDEWLGWPRLTLDESGNIIVVMAVRTVAPWNDVVVVKVSETGEVDASFGSGGNFTFVMENGHFQAKDVAVQPDGKVLVIGKNAEDFFAFRLDETGSLDAGFGNGGTITADLYSVSNGVNDSEGDEIADLLLEDDGKWVVAGTVGAGFSENREFVIARFLENGSFDTSFHMTGVSVMGLSGEDRCHVVGKDAEGNYYLVGQAGLEFDEFAVQKVLPDGNRDTSYGEEPEGWTRIEGIGIGWAVRVDADGSLFAAANGPTPQLLRFGSNGMLDATFEGDGISQAEPVDNITFSNFFFNAEGDVLWGIGGATDENFNVSVQVSKFSFGEGSANGIEGHVVERIFNLYPNPAINTVFLSMEGAPMEELEITVRSLDGKVVSSMKSVQSPAVFSVADLKSGCYLVEVELKDTLFIERLLVK